MCGYVEKYHICGLKVEVCIICGCALYMGTYGTSELMFNAKLSFVPDLPTTTRQNLSKTLNECFCSEQTISESDWPKPGMEQQEIQDRYPCRNLSLTHAHLAAFPPFVATRVSATKMDMDTGCRRFSSNFTCEENTGTTVCVLLIRDMFS